MPSFTTTHDEEIAAEDLAEAQRAGAAARLSRPAAGAAEGRGQAALPTSCRRRLQAQQEPQLGIPTAREGHPSMPGGWRAVVANPDDARCPSSSRRTRAVPRHGRDRCCWTIPGSMRGAADLGSRRSCAGCAEARTLERCGVKVETSSASRRGPGRAARRARNGWRRAARSSRPPESDLRHIVYKIGRCALAGGCATNLGLMMKRGAPEGEHRRW